VLGRKGDLRHPRAVAVNNAGTLFISQDNSEKLKILPLYDSGAGEEYQDFDLSPHRRKAPIQPVALFVDFDSNLYVADRGNRQILVFGHNRELSVVIPDVGEPADVWAQAGKIYVADPGFGGIRIYNSAGNQLRTVGIMHGQFNEPLRVKALSVDMRERIWALEEADRGIKALDPLGNIIVSLPFSRTGQMHIFSAVDLALDQNNYLYVLEMGRSRINVYRISEF